MDYRNVKCDMRQNWSNLLHKVTSHMKVSRKFTFKAKKFKHTYAN